MAERGTFREQTEPVESRRGGGFAGPSGRQAREDLEQVCLPQVTVHLSQPVLISPMGQQDGGIPQNLN